MPWARPLLGHRVWVGDGAVPGMAAPCQAAWVLCGCSAPSRQLPSINLEPPNWSLPGLGASSWQHGAGALPSQGVRAWRRAGAGLALCALPSVLLSSPGRVPVHQHTARGSNRVPAFLLLLLFGTQSFGPCVPGSVRCGFGAVSQHLLQNPALPGRVLLVLLLRRVLPCWDGSWCPRLKLGWKQK